MLFLHWQFIVFVQDVCALTAKLEEALQELHDLQEREAQHSRLMEQLVQQRNHYREMALQAGTGSRSTHEVALSPMKLVSTFLSLLNKSSRDGEINFVLTVEYFLKKKQIICTNKIVKLFL